MKKSFIFPEELAVEICVLPADERILAYDHIIKGRKAAWRGISRLKLLLTVRTG